MVVCARFDDYKQKFAKIFRPKTKIIGAFNLDQEHTSAHVWTERLGGNFNQFFYAIVSDYCKKHSYVFLGIGGFDIALCLVNFPVFCYLSGSLSIDIMRINIMRILRISMRIP